MNLQSTTGERDLELLMFSLNLKASYVENSLSAITRRSLLHTAGARQLGSSALTAESIDGIPRTDDDDA